MKIEEQVVKNFLLKLKQAGNPTQVDAAARYHKSSREHWGVSAPECNKLVVSFSQQLKDEKACIALAKAFWMTDLFDPMICAAKLLSLRSIKPSKLLWDTLKQFLTHIDGWALEDTLAHVAWKCILADEDLLNDVENWRHHPNFWMRRATLVYTLPFAKRGKDPERMLGWASSYAEDKEWFMQKAIGWWLRVLGEHNPERVMTFLERHWTQLKGVAKKEATRKLHVGLQQKALLFTPILARQL